MRTAFPHFGAKGDVAFEVWRRFGDPIYYYEPFGGTLGNLLNRPETDQIRHEVVGDADCLIANFFRAAKLADPVALARLADWPASQIDLESRVEWLREQRDWLRGGLRSNPVWYDLETAAWFAWVQSVKVGAGGSSVRVRQVSSGVRRRTQDLTEYFRQLSDRLRDVVLHFGDWTTLARAAEMESRRHPTAILLDPPYKYSTGRRRGMYATDSANVAEWVCRWAIARSLTHPNLRIALCGLAGEHQLPADWSEVAWMSKLTRGTERIWFSPSCENA